MTTYIAEYLGQRTDSNKTVIQPVTKISEASCPFSNLICTKFLKKTKPFCSVRRTSDDILWISCEHRLCSTSKVQKIDDKKLSLDLSKYQKDFLYSLSKQIWGNQISKNNVRVFREKTLQSKHRLDYTIVLDDDRIYLPRAHQNSCRNARRWRNIFNWFDNKYYKSLGE